MKLEYHIAGKADDVNFAKAVRIAEILKLSLEEFDFEKQVVPPEEWSVTLQEICAKHNFQHKLSPLIYSYTGKYIGSLLDFEIWVKRMYNHVPKFDHEDFISIANENLQNALRSIKELKEEQAAVRHALFGRLVTHVTAQLATCQSSELPVLKQMCSHLRIINGMLRTVQQLVDRPSKKKRWQREFEIIFSSLPLKQIPFDLYARSLRYAEYELRFLETTYSKFRSKSLGVDRYQSIIELYYKWTQLSESLEFQVTSEGWNVTTVIADYNDWVQMHHVLFGEVHTLKLERAKDQRETANVLKRVVDSSDRTRRLEFTKKYLADDQSINDPEQEQLLRELYQSLEHQN